MLFSAAASDPGFEPMERWNDMSSSIEDLLVPPAGQPVQWTTQVPRQVKHEVDFGEAFTASRRFVTGKITFILRLERVWEAQNRRPVLVVSGAIMLAVAALDWWTKPYVSLGFL